MAEGFSKIEPAKAVEAAESRQGLTAPRGAPASQVHAQFAATPHPKWWAGLPGPAAPLSRGENRTGTVTGKIGDKPGETGTQFRASHGETFVKRNAGGDEERAPPAIPLRDNAFVSFGALATRLVDKLKTEGA